MPLNNLAKYSFDAAYGKDLAWIGKWIIDLGALPAFGRVLGGQGGGS